MDVLRSLLRRPLSVLCFCVLLALVGSENAGKGSPSSSVETQASGLGHDEHVKTPLADDAEPSVVASPSPSLSVTARPKIAFKQFLIDEVVSNHSLVRSELIARGWREPSRGAKKRMGGPWKGSMADFLWTWSNDRTKSVAASSGHILINHFPQFEEIGSKVGLWKNLYALHQAAERARHGALNDADQRPVPESVKNRTHAEFVAERHGREMPEVHKFFPRCYFLARDPQAEGRSALAVDASLTIRNMKGFVTDFVRSATIDAAADATEVAICDGDSCAFPSATSREVEPWPTQPTIDGTKNIWIAKPSRAARGVDIQLFSNLTELLQFTLGAESAHLLSLPIDSSNISAASSAPLMPAPPSQPSTPGIGLSDFSSINDMTEIEAPIFPSPSFIVQKYIERPLLVKGFKFDVRQFVLVTSLNPLVVFVSDDFYLRFTAQAFTLDNISDRYLHLTNHQVQKDSPDFHQTEIEDNQWSSQTFIQHLSENFGEGTWEKVVKPRVDELIITTVLSWPATGHRNNSFEVLGFDIMLDEDLQPWLLEVNTNPGLHLLTDVVKVHHPRFIADMFKVILDERESWKSLPEFYPPFLRTATSTSTDAPLYGSLRLAYKGLPYSYTMHQSE